MQSTSISAPVKHDQHIIDGLNKKSARHFLAGVMYKDVSNKDRDVKDIGILKEGVHYMISYLKSDQATYEDKQNVAESLTKASMHIKVVIGINENGLYIYCQVEAMLKIKVALN